MKTSGVSENIPLLFANCKLTKGASRSIIIDLIKNNLHLIPNDLYQILLSHKGKSINAIKAFYQHKYDDTIDEYFLFLKDNDLIFFTKTPELFPDIPDTWFEPTHITNILVDIGALFKENINSVIDQIEQLNCKNIQLRFFESLDIEILKELIGVIEDRASCINSIDIIMSKGKNIPPLQKLEKLMTQYSRISNFMVYDCSACEWEEIKHNSKQTIVLSSKKILSHLSCGIIDSFHFAPNMKHYTESLHHNTCLNRKIAIDVDGNIKNCPSMKESFGNIKDTTLEEAIKKPGFKKYWNIKKDEITKCKDCEFRHVCTDCRAYLETPEDSYSAPLKCGYDPYTCTWEEWSTSPLKQKAIDYYGMRSILNS